MHPAFKIDRKDISIFHHLPAKSTNKKNADTNGAKPVDP